jgi:hypothetical protein
MKGKRQQFSTRSVLKLNTHGRKRHQYSPRSALKLNKLERKTPPMFTMFSAEAGRTWNKNAINI